MNKYEIIKRIENFAPVQSAEPWDCVGFMVETSKPDIKKIMLCLTPVANVVKQAKEQNCDMIIAHHPAFFVPLDWADIDIYSAHTNLDKTNGGTTDTIIKTLGLEKFKLPVKHDFLRIVEFPQKISVNDFSQMLVKISPNARIVNNYGQTTLKKAAFCAGSGTEFITEAKKFGADCLVTGDLKFHTALDSSIIVYDIGHFESEILILPVLKKLIGDGVEIVYADEKSPFRMINSIQ